MIDQPMANTIYVSTSNQMKISSTIVNSDWFMCKWTTIKTQKSDYHFKIIPLFKKFTLITILFFAQLFSISVCQDRKASASSGIIQQPAGGQLNEFLTCLFTISVPPGQRVQMSCSNVDLNGRTSSLKVRR